MGSPYLQPVSNYNASPTYYYPGSDPSQVMYDQSGRLVDPASLMDPAAMQDPALYSQAMDANPPVEHPKEEKKGFFDKIGAVFKGVLDAPGKILSGLTDPKNLLMIGAGIAISVLFPPAAPFVAAAGVAMAGMGVAQGASAMAAGWANDDLDAIREGSGIAAANGLGVVLGVKGLKSSTIRNLRASGVKRIKVKDMRGRVRNIKVDDLSTWQAIRLQPRAFKSSMAQFKKDFARTSGSLPQRLVAVARQNAKGAPAGHRPRRRLTRAQRGIAFARMGLDAARLVQSIRTAQVPGGTLLTDALRTGWTGRTGASAFARNMNGAQRLGGVLFGQGGAPITQQVLQFAARHGEAFGYGGKTTTFLRGAGQLAGSYADFQGLRSHGTAFWNNTGRAFQNATPTSTSFFGRLGQRLQAVQWRNAAHELYETRYSVNTGTGAPSYRMGTGYAANTNFGQGLFTNASNIFNNAKFLQQWAMRRPGFGENLAKAQETQRLHMDGATFLQNVVDRFNGVQNPSTRTYSLAMDGLSLFDRGRNLFLEASGKTANIGNTIPNSTGSGIFGRFGQQNSKAFEFVKAHPGAIEGSLPLPIATGIQGDLQKKYMEMAQMQQLALSGMQAQA